MRNQKMDIWSHWLDMGVIVVKNKNPIVNNEVYAYLYDKDSLSDEMQLKIQKNHGLPEKDNYVLHEDCMINMLYFAAIKAKVGIRIFGVDQHDIAVSYQELHEIEAQIDQLESVFGYITKQSTLEELARDLNNRKLFYSTPFGENTKGEKKLFLCSSPADKVVYFPVFFTREHLSEFETRFQRANYLILEDYLGSILSTLDANEKLKELGVIIEPFYNCRVQIPPMFRIKQ